MKNIFISIYIILAPLLLLAQKYDYQWPMGYSASIPHPEFGISLLNFNQPAIEVHAFNQDFNPIDIHNGSSFICDEKGELLLVTNNCKVFDKDFQTVPGTDTLTPGITFNSFCEQSGEYPTSQTSLILPEVTNDSTFYIIHKDSELSNALQDKISKKLYLSTLVRKEDGSFYLWGTRLLMDQEMIPGKITACINNDGDKWWTWTADYHSNAMYKFLIGGQDTVQGPFVQEIGERIRDKDNGGIGQTVFSPNADALAYLTTDHKILLYDFDNETGELSNYQCISVADDDEGYGRGLAFSFDSRFIYLSTVKNLYQVDLVDSTWEHIAFHESYDENGWPVGIGKMQLGPDCRIYASPGSTSYYIHVIHHPNQKGEACGFQARALRSLTIIDRYFPNLPMYRFGGACDSTIQFPVVGSEEVGVEKEAGVHVFPNPAKEYISVRLPEHFPRVSEMSITDITGRKIKTLDIPYGQKEVEVSTSGFSDGIYFLFFDDGSVRPLKLVIAH